MRGKIEEIEKLLTPKKKLQAFAPGDTVEVHAKVIEGDKERVQIFEGIIISVRGGEGSPGQSFTVRKVVQGEGIERNFLINSPRLVKVVVKKRGRVRRARLFYLRDRVGRAGKVQEVFASQEGAAHEAPEEKPVPAPAKDGKTTEKAEKPAPAKAETK
jgi:large subunit ribosomal protein L19